MRNIIITGLFHFVKLVEDFEKSFVDTHKVSEIPINSIGLEIPAIGTINVGGLIGNYRFHGLSCQIEIGRYRLDYYNNLNSKHRISVTLFYFTKFLQSFFNTSEVNELNPNAPVEVEREFDILIQEGLLEYSDSFPGIYSLKNKKMYQREHNG